MPLILDPATRVIEPDHQIFVIHPGAGKRFYQDFMRTSSVFLDLPGIDFTAAPDITSEETRRLLRMSRSIGGWYKSGRPAARVPSRNALDYRVAVEGRDPPRFMTEVKTLYVDAKPGDLIIIPGPGYNSAVLMAEIAGPFDPGYRINSDRYGAEFIPARKVNFLRTTHAKYEFGRRAIRLMQNRQAIIRVNDNADRHEFYEHAYGDYVWGDRSGSYMEVTENVIDQKDLTDVLFLTNVYGAMYVALKAGELETFMKLPLHKAVNTYYNRELFGDISIEVHSPGFFGRPIRNAAIAAFIATMTVLATNGVAPVEAAQIKVENSVNEGRVSACDLQLEEDVAATMKMVTNSHLWWEDICEMQKDASEKTGLKTKAKLVDRKVDGN